MMTVGTVTELSSLVRNDTINIKLKVLKNADVMRLYPDTILMGLQKVGSLIAILKFSLILRYFHQRQFEKKLEQLGKRDLPSES